MDDREQLLAEELKIGKEKTLKIFYEEYFALFVSFANNLLPSEEECKDVVHDVFLKYWDCRGDFNSLIAIRAFFYKSIRNACLNILRHQQVHNKFIAENLQYLQSEDFMHETIMKKEIFHIIHNEIKHLTGMEQKILLLALEEKSNEEIAQELGIAVSTVKSHKAKSYAELRQKLKYLKTLLLLLS
ncbi:MULTISPECIES: RNA polymerase sigma factor [unclassified Butyricimonas]|uniref:RNA polymerase sigma factor n=1 Tax=unclassified Butyricimonas TaxID=2637652 RepID=UPI00159BA707|nr:MULTISPECIES: sigma-70 family RNA polymerase sigma factor [unclassified Butyricimonas]